MIAAAFLILLALAALALLALWATGRFMRLRRGRPSQSIPPGTGAPLDTLGVEGARLIPAGAEALALRLASARLARRSLDLMYYHWEDDLTGRLLAQELLAAAETALQQHQQ